MRKIIFLVPILFLGIKPYQQNIIGGQSVDSLSQFEKDTLLLSFVKTNLDVQLTISEQLDKRKQELRRELKAIKKQEREQRRKKQLNEKHENRGL